MDDAQAGKMVVDSLGITRERGLLAERQGTRPRDIDSELFNNHARRGRNYQDAVGQTNGLLHAMSDEENRRPIAHPELFEIVADLETRQSVERTERLVHQQNRWAKHQSARQRVALAHAARKLVRITVRGLWRQAKAVKQLPRPFAHGGHR